MVLNISKKRKTTKYIQRDLDGSLYCYICGKFLPDNNFDDSPQESDVFYRNGKDKRCRNCKKDQYLNRRLRNRGRKDLDRILLERWHGMKDRAIKKNFELNISLDEIKTLWNKQEGKCAISGIDMTYIFNGGRIPTNVSIDRIDSSRGYTIDNIQLVCMAVNQMKNDLSMDYLYFLCDSVLKHKKEIENENKNN